MKSQKNIPILQLVIIALLVLVIIVLAGVCYNVYVKSVDKKVVDAIEVSDDEQDEQDEQVDYEAEINRLLDEMTPFVNEIVDKYIFIGYFSAGCGRYAHYNDSATCQPCKKCFDKLDALRDKMTQKQLERFDELCNPIIPFIKAYSPESEIAKRVYEMPMKAKVDKYPVTFVLTSDGESFDGGYVGYYYYESQGPERKIWLKIETSYYEERSALYEYVNNNRIGRFEIFGPSGISINADEFYIYYCNNDKRLIVNFELKDKKRDFIDLLERHGYKRILL